MKFADILALRPEADDSASIRAAIERADLKRIEAINRAGDLERRMSAGLLTDDDATMAANEQAATEAKRAADRIEALLAEMRVALAAAEQREGADHAEELRQAARDADAAFCKLYQRHRDKLLEACGAILVAKRAADAAISAADLGAELLARHSVEDFRPGHLVHQQAWRLILQLAELSPQEAERKRQLAAAERERETARQAELDRRAAEGRARVRAEQEAADRERDARTTTASQMRVPPTFIGDPGYSRSAAGW